VLGKGLLGEHVYAGIQGCHRYRRMQRSGGGNAQQINLSMINQILPSRVPVLRTDVVRVTETLQSVWFHTGQGDKINITCSRVPGHMLLSRPTQTDHASTKSITAGHTSTPSATTRLPS
jgi:hypothetical protein